MGCVTTSLAKYLYCIIRCPEERTFDEVAPIGGHNGTVHTISHQGLAVVVSDSPTAGYVETRANLLAHERVQERAAREFTLLPVRFGTVAGSSRPVQYAVQDVRRLLGSRFREFDGLLQDMEGKVELGLKALWRSEPAIFEEIVAQNEGIRRLRNSIQGKPPQATHFDRIRLGEMIKGALDRKRAGEAEGILVPLRRVALRVVENPIVMDRMIVNAAFLVAREREGEFDRAVHGLDEKLGNRVAFKYVGPVPPYNFVNIVVNWQDL